MWIPSGGCGGRGLKEDAKQRYREKLERLAQERNHPQVRAAALNALEKTGISQGFSKTLTHLAFDRHQPMEIRQRAINILKLTKDLPYTFILDVVEALKQTNDFSFQWEVTEILAAFPPRKEMQKGLLSLIRHPYANVRRKAIIALGKKAIVRPSIT